MSSYSKKLWINCGHADPGGCICIIYLQDSKCDTFSLLANTHDPENRSQKLNDIHMRRLINLNRHTDSLISVARSHHCYQVLAVINNATNDSLVNSIVLWTLIHATLDVVLSNIFINLSSNELKYLEIISQYVIHDIQISHKFPGILFRFEDVIDFTVFVWKTTMYKHKRCICLLDFIDVPRRFSTSVSESVLREDKSLAHKSRGIESYRMT